MTFQTGSKFKIFDKKYWSKFIFLSILVLGILVLLIAGNIICKLYENGCSYNIVKSDFSIPSESILLKRYELIAEINDFFKPRKGIQTIALVGIGGSGKTTLARYYAYSQKKSVIWEINAETRKTLRKSFEDLAKSLIKSEADQRTLSETLAIKNIEIREKLIVEFVKKRLKASSDWILIYDNVESFSDVKSFFPSDTEKWGNGKVLLTTQDGSIDNNKNINYIIHIKELTPAEKLYIFTKIMSNGNGQEIISTKKEDLIKFLCEIPPFPLDVSTAAYYLKITNISYEEYLNKLAECHNSFNEIQKKLLSEAGDYTKTRYSILALSLENLTKVCKEFRDLLIILGLFDSQHIPRLILDNLKDSIIVDDFIIYSKKYSLLIDDLAIPSIGQTISLHRCTQLGILYYFKEFLKTQKGKDLIFSVTNEIENFLKILLDQEDREIIELFINHLQMFLRHDFLPPTVRGQIEAQLGYLYYASNDLKHSKVFLEKSLKRFLLTKNETNYDKISSIYFYLGNISKDFGNYEIAKKYIEEGLDIYKEYNHQKHQDIARGLFFLGNVHRYLKNYKKARDFLEQSLLLYKKYCPEKNKDIAWVSSYLGTVYNYLKEYNKAEILLKETLAVYEKYYGKTHIKTARVIRNLGNVYFLRGQLELSEHFYYQALEIFQKHQHSEIYRALENLADVYLQKSLQAQNKGKKKNSLAFKAQALKDLKKALQIAKAWFPENSPHIKRIQDKLYELSR